MSLLERLHLRKRRSGRTPDRREWHDSTGRIIREGDVVESTKGWIGTVIKTGREGVVVQPDATIPDSARTLTVLANWKQ